MWAETILLLVLALVVSAVVKTFFVQMFFVPSGSMRPLFVDDDRILVQKISYWAAATCSAATSWSSTTRAAAGSAPRASPALSPVQKVLSEVGLYPTGGHLVKRVIGVGGDRVVCCDDRRPGHRERRTALGEVLHHARAPTRRTAGSTSPCPRAGSG